MGDLTLLIPDPLWQACFAFVFAYLLGSIPFELVLTKLAGLGDIRAIGSGNIGATNVLRTGKKSLAIATLLLDGLKGTLAVFLLREMHGEAWELLSVAGAFLGHVFPVWLRFQGGKGVATLLGMALAIQPVVALLCLVVFLITLLSTRFVSLSSMLAGVAFMVLILFIFNEKETMYRLFAVMVAMMVIITHQKNITRLLKGTENKVPSFKNRARRSLK